MKTRDVIGVLRERHDPKMWAFFEELRLGTGYGGKWEQRIDVWVMHYYPSTGLERISYEVKVSRADFLAELRQPRKRQAAMEMSNYFYFAVPPGVVKDLDEIPNDCGLVVIRDGKYRVEVKATYRDCPSPPWRFVASLARRIKHLENSDVD